jgi:hypothetical protein
MRDYTFKDLFRHKKNPALYALALLFFMLSITVYALYFDILLPGFADGSYRKAVGNLFIIPSILLAFGQIFVGGFFLHMISMALTRRSDFLKALVSAGAMTFMFSLTYVMFPFYGPFYYIIFVLTGPSYALPVEIAYTTAMVLISSYIIRKFYGMDSKISIFVAMAILVGITVAAS